MMVAVDIEKTLEPTPTIDDIDLIRCTMSAEEELPIHSRGAPGIYGIQKRADEGLRCKRSKASTVICSIQLTVQKINSSLGGSSCVRSD
jgi:hypothetical protein